MSFDPSEPRDETGKWTGGGSEPVTLYHGTATGKPHEAHEGGYFLSPSENLAGVYGKVLKAQVRMSKPIDMRDKAKIAEFTKKRKGKEGIAAYAKRAGYDGVIDNNGSVIVLHPEQIVRADWDESQHPRGQPENAGEFVKGGGGGGKGFEFVSPNIREGTKLKQARIGLKGTRHKFIVHAGEEVDKALGVEADVKPVIGMWADGAENSTMSIIDNPPWETLTASAAMKGWLAKQKQVLIFKEGDTDPKHGDEAGLASFSAKGKPEEISQWLGENGLPYHTLEPTNGGSTVYVYGNDKDTGHALVEAGKHYGSEVKVRRGRGAFLGTHKEDGSDAEQRADARAEFDRLLVQPGDQRTAVVWKGLRDRLGPQADEIVSDQTETPHFKAWFGDSKIVDADGQPQVMYHGTLGNFESFDKSRASVEGNWGAGFYFTNNQNDLSSNYAGHGPDMTSKIDTLADQIQDNEEFEGDYEAAQAEAERRIGVENEGAAIPVFLKMEKPFKIGGQDETHLDFDTPYDEDKDEYGEASGKAQELVDALREMKESGDYDDDIGIDNLANDLQEHALENDGIQASKLELIASKAENFAYVSNLDGKFVASDILRKALHKIGFDGIIDTRVYQKFPRMPGMTQSTAHYIVFDPHQIKSAIGNKGTFDPQSTKITDSQPDIRADAYNPNEARIPKGQPGAGQWTSGGAGMGFTPGPPSKTNVKLWKHASGNTLAVNEKTGGWAYKSPDDTIVAGGEDEESLNKWINEHKGELEPPGGKLIKDLKDMGFKDGGIYGYTHVFSKDKHTFNVDARNGDWTWEHENGSTQKGSGEYDMLQTAASYFPEADALLAKVPKPPPPAPADLPANGFTKDDKLSNDSMTVWQHQHAGTLKVQNATGKWKYGDDPDGTEAEGDDVKSMNKWIDQNKEELKPKPPTTYEPHPDALVTDRGEFNRVLSEKLEKEFVAVAPELDATAAKLYKDDAPVGGEEEDEEEEDEESATPESWEELSADQQETVEQKWSSDNYSDWYDTEVSNWQESGQPLHEAKVDLANEGADAEYVDDTVQTFLDDWEGDPDDPEPVPYTKAQLLAALTVDEYHDKYDDGASDPEFSFDDERLKEPADLAYDPEKQGVLPGFQVADPALHFTRQMREDLEDRLTKAFNEQADKAASDVEAPDYLKESTEESLGEYWDQKDDEEKFKHAENYLDFDEGKPAKEAKAKVEKLDHPPRNYDPLSFKPGTPDYTRTQHISRALSLQRAADVLTKRGLIKVKPRDVEGHKRSMVEGIAGDSRLYDDVLAHLTRGYDHINELQGRTDVPGIKTAWLAYQFRQTAQSMLAVMGKPDKANPLAVKLAMAAHPHWEYGKIVTDWVRNDNGKVISGLTPEESQYVEKNKDNISAFVADAIDNYAEEKAAKAIDSPEKVREKVAAIDNTLWRGWVGSSTSFEGKMIQIGAADEFDGLLRIPTGPKLEPEPIKETTDAEAIEGYGEKNNFANADLRMMIQSHLREEMGNPATLEKLPQDGTKANMIPILVQGLLKLSPGEDGAAKIDFDWDQMKPAEVASIKAIQPEVEAAVRSGITQRREDLNANRRIAAEQAAKLKWGGYKPLSEDAALLEMENLPSPNQMREAFETGLISIGIESGAHFGLSKRLAQNDFWRSAITKKDGKVTFDPAKFDIANYAIDPTFPNRTEIRDALDKPAARAELAKVARLGFENYREWRDQYLKGEAEHKYDAAKGDAWEPKEELIKQADQKYPEIGGYAGIKAMMRAKWETTQWMMAKAGIHEFSAYRGILDPQVNDDDIEKVDVEADGQHYTRLPGYKLLRNGAASTALKASVSNNWHHGRGGDDTRVVLRVRMPRTAALSVPSYGQNEAAEREVIVMGTAWKDWDAFKKTAPEFDVLPIGATGEEAKLKEAA